MKNRTKKRKCILCGGTLAPASVEGFYLHEVVETCGVRVADADGVSLDDTHVVEDGVVYELAVEGADVVEEPAAVEPSTYDGLALVVPVDLMSSAGVVETEPYVSVEWALQAIFDAAGVPRLGGASGDQGWSSFSTFQKCPYLWKRRYVDTKRGLLSKTPSAPALELGTLVHALLAVDYARQIDVTYPLDSEQLHAELVQSGVTPEYLAEAKRLISAYYAYYALDTGWRPLAVEHHVVDPKTKQSCRIDVIMERTETAPGLPAGTYLWDHKCVTGDTQVWDYASQRPYTFDELFKFGIAPLVQAYDVGDGTLRLAQAHVPEPDTVRDVYAVKLTSGRRLKTSDNHPFLTARGWVPADQLTTDDWIGIPTTTSVGDFDSGVTDNEVIFAGYMLGEGSFGSGQIRWTQAPGPVLERFQFIANTLADCHGDPRPLVTQNRDVFTVSFTNHRQSWFRNFFKGHGLTGLRSREKHVPSAFMALPDRQTALLLGALWDADGAVEVIAKRELTPTIRFATSSPQLACDVQRLLLRLGIWSTSTCQRMTVKGEEYLFHHVTVITTTGKRRFLEMVVDGQITSARLVAAAQDALTYLGQDAGDPVPVAWLRGVLADHATKVSSGSNVLSKFKRDPSTYVRRSTLEAWTEAVPAFEPFLHADVRWERVDTVLCVGRERLYNLTVPGPQTFVANDIITHNTASRFDYATLNGWKNDGEIIGLWDLYERTKMRRRFGDLQGICVNIIGKQKTPQFHRTWVFPSRALVRDHRTSLRVWAAAIETAQALGSFPRARAACVTKFGQLCDEFDRCSQDDPVLQAQEIQP